MKAPLKHIAAALIVMLLLPGCRKGEDDPLVSLRTRKARLEGKWRFTQGTVTYTYVDISKWTRLNQLFRLTSTHFELTETGAALPEHSSGNYLLSLNIDRQGSFTVRETFQNRVLEASGIWDFAMGSKDEKKKESVNFMIEDVQKGSTGNFNLFNWASTSMSYRIKELRSKKLVLTRTATVFENPGGLSVMYQGEYVFTQ